MSINLCIDWGNTNIKAAIFDNDKLTKQFTFSPNVCLEKVTEILNTYKPVKAILCSVVGQDNELADLVKGHIKTLVKLDGHTRTPINNAYLSATIPLTAPLRIQVSVS